MQHNWEFATNSLVEDVEAVNDGYCRTVLLARLSERRGGGAHLLDRALESAARLPARFVRAEALCQIAVCLAEPDAAVLVPVLRAIRAVARPLYTAHALEELAPILSEDVVREAFDQALAISTEPERVRGLVALAPVLPVPMVEETIHEVKLLRGEAARLDLLCGLRPHVPETLWPMAIECAQATLSHAYWLNMLGGCAPFLPPGLVRVAMHSAESVAGGVRWQVPSGLCVPLNDARDEAPLQSPWDPVVDVCAAREWRALATRVLARASKSVRPPAPSPVGLSTVRFASVPMLESERDRVAALTRLGPELTVAQFAAALGVVRQLRSDENRLAALQALVPVLSPETLPDAWQIVKGLQSETARLNALSGLTVGFQKDGTPVFQNLSPPSCSSPERAASVSY